MAGNGRARPARARPADPARTRPGCGGRAPRAPRSARAAGPGMSEGGSRRGLLRLGLSAPLFALDLPVAAAATILAVRVWPAPDYTRVTLEHDSKPVFSHATLTGPHRLMVDLEGIQVDGPIRDVVSKVRPDDPYIARVRIGLNRPGVVRLVFDLKQPVRPQLFTLTPVGDYQHRLVIDLHPVVERDPLVALLEQSGDEAAP